MATDSMLTCPDCGRRFEGVGGRPGRSVECPHCGTAFLAPPRSSGDLADTGRLLKTRVMGADSFEDTAAIKRAFYSRGAGHNPQKLHDARPGKSLYRRSKPASLRLKQKAEPESFDGTLPKVLHLQPGAPWLKVLRPWLPLSGVFMLIFAEFASVCMMTLPVIGIIPGPPSQVMQAIFACGHLIGCMAALFWAVPMLAEGTWLQRVTVAACCVVTTPIIYFAAKMVTATLASIVVP